MDPIPLDDVFTLGNFHVVLEDMSPPPKAKGKMKYQFDTELAHTTSSHVSFTLDQT